MSRKHIAVAVLAGAGVCAVLLAWFYGKPAYRKHQEQQAIAAAKAAFERRDFGAASVAARKALQYNPANLQACQVMAQLAELAGAPQALEWHRKIVELNPTLESKFRLASCALKFEAMPFPTASKVLAEAMSTASNNAVTHALSAELALRMSKPGEAAKLFETAQQLDPANEGYRFNLAVLRLESPDPKIAAEARQTLETMRAGARWKETALRWLVAERLKRDDAAGARQWSEELIAAPQRTFEDQLLHLRVLKRTGDTQAFEQARATTEREASTNAAQAYLYTTWNLENLNRESALKFLESLPADVRSSQFVAMAFVECYVHAKDWPGLEEFLQDKKWGEREYMRLALLSRAAAEQGNDRAADTRWRSAVRETGGSLADMVNLLGLAKAAGRDSATEELLWHIYQKFPREKWILLELDRHYARTGNTRGLHRVYSILGLADTNNLVALNNLAATALLLSLDVEKAHTIARDIYTRCPTNPTIASTYAFSLHRQGHTAEGLEILEKLEPAAREKPPVALYYGVLLAKSGKTNQAQPYLKTATESPCLPEERALAENAFN